MDGAGRRSRSRSWGIAGAILLALAAGTPGRLLAFKGCAESLAGQSLQPPSSLWGAMEPVRVLVNATNWTGSQRPNLSYQISTTVDIENGWIFHSFYGGFSIWDARANPANPTRVALMGGYEGAIVGWDPAGEFTQVVFGIDAPEGVDTIMALAAMPQTVGLTLWDTTVKAVPRQLYQDKTRASYQVYTARIGGRDYAFVADFLPGQVNGLYLYDMTTARNFTFCSESTPAINCPGVFLGRIGSFEQIKYVQGLAVGGRHFVVTSGGDQSGTGIRIWDVTIPLVPVPVVSAFQGFSTHHATHGVAMWTQDGRHYLAARHDDTAKIFDVTTCLTVGCPSLPSLQIWSEQLRPMPEAQYWMSATFSRSGSTPFVFFGHHDTCVQGEAPGHKEMLYDVSDAAQPREVTPPQTIQHEGETVDYWSWYSSDNVRGFGNYGPRVAKFHGAYLYRAAATIFDIHRYAGPPVANFSWSPQAVYPGQAVDFTSTSTGAPTSHLWSFPDGAAAGAPSQGPAAASPAASPAAAPEGPDGPPQR